MQTKKLTISHGNELGRYLTSAFLRSVTWAFCAAEYHASSFCEIVFAILPAVAIVDVGSRSPVLLHGAEVLALGHRVVRKNLVHWQLFQSR